MRNVWPILISCGLLISCAAKKPVKGYTIIIQPACLKRLELRGCTAANKCADRPVIQYRNDPACVLIGVPPKEMK